MDIRSLQSFLAVAETGNFTHAAQALYVTQPTLSRRIASLEEELGTVLFVRERDGVVLTDAGRALVHEAEFIIGRIDSLPLIVSQAAGRDAKAEDLVTGTLRIATQTMIDDSYPRRVGMVIQERYPGIDLSVQNDYPPSLRHLLEARKVDLAFFLRPAVSSTSQLLTRKVGESRIQLMVCEGHPFFGRESVDIHELLGQEVIMLDRKVSPEIVDYINSRFVNAGFSLNAVRYVEDIENAAVLVSAGKGVSFAHSMMSFIRPLASAGVATLDITGADFTVDFVARLRDDLSADIREAVLSVLDTVAWEDA